MSKIEYNNPCSCYAEDCDPEEWQPCRCPICNGFLPGDIFQDPLICKKCGSELVAIPLSEKQKESDDWEGEEGKICVVTKRHDFKKPKRKSDSYSYQI